jgi:4-diphosphocytidyl-2-C-methyl-D-erythritol kinase
MRATMIRKNEHLDELSLPSYAKINLGLTLLRKREDGYHDIETIFQQIDLHDMLFFKKTPSDIRIVSKGFPVPSDKNNLAYKAFELFRINQGIDEGIEIHIEKTIPVGGGLGGGSSNAAATLLAANHLWKTNLTFKKLEVIAAEIGSDVPFFIRGGTAIGKGRGEKLKPIQLPDNYWIVLICPCIELSTSWAYQHSKITLTKNKKITKLNSIFENQAPHAYDVSLENDLEGVVFQRHPILKELKEQLYQRGAFYASMSGSGSTILGLFSEKKRAEAESKFFHIQKKLPVFLCKPISTKPVK